MIGVDNTYTIKEISDMLSDRIKMIRNKFKKYNIKPCDTKRMHNGKGVFKGNSLTNNLNYPVGMYRAIDMLKIMILEGINSHSPVTFVCMSDDNIYKILKREDDKNYIVIVNNVYSLCDRHEANEMVNTCLYEDMYCLIVCIKKVVADWEALVGIRSEHEE